MGGGGWVGGWVGVGNCVSKENPKSDLNLDLGFVNSYLDYKYPPGFTGLIDPKKFNKTHL